MPLVGQLNDLTGIVTKPISIRKILADNKIDMFFFRFNDMVPTACRKFKKLCTRITKKKEKTADATSAHIKVYFQFIESVVISASAATSVYAIFSISFAKCTIPCIFPNISVSSSSSNTAVISAWCISTVSKNGCLENSGIATPSVSAYLLVNGPSPSQR